MDTPDPRPPFDATLVSRIAEALEGGRLDTALAGQTELAAHAKAIAAMAWERTADLAAAAYLAFNPVGEVTLRGFRPAWIAAAVAFDLVQWPKRILPWVRGRTVADVGCGPGAYALGYVIAGAAEYVGIDPSIDVHARRARDKTARAFAPFPCSPAEVAARFPQVSFVAGTIEAMAGSRRFDTLVMHNVTEHLMDIEATFAGVAAMAHAQSSIIFVHHNYYCWNGHHQAPVSPAALVEDDPEQAALYDWRHIRFAPPPDHEIAIDLNRIRLDDLRALCERHWVIETWNERRAPPAVAARMTPQIRAGLNEFSDADLFVHGVFAVARPK